MGSRKQRQIQISRGGKLRAVRMFLDKNIDNVHSEFKLDGQLQTSCYFIDLDGIDHVDIIKKKKEVHEKEDLQVDNRNDGRSQCQ